MNLGGFCNATHLPPLTGTPESIRGSDICPCNHLLDAGARRWLDQAYDHDGAAALAETPDADAVAMILTRLEEEQAEANRSLGTGDERLEVIELLDTLPTPAKRLATLSSALGELITRAVPDSSDILLFGGGAYNSGLRRSITNRLGEDRVRTGAPGIGVDAREAAAMAVLGTLAHDGIDITLECVTGRTPAHRFRAGRWFIAQNQDVEGK